MRSIRFSLVVYFFTLLVLGLGGVSALTYGTTATSLRDKEAIDRSLIEAQHAKDTQELRAKFDFQLTKQARKLLGQHNARPQPRLEALNVLGVITTALPFSHLNSLFYVRLLGNKLPSHPPIRQPEPRPLDYLIDEPVEDEPAEYCQTFHSRGGGPWEKTKDLPADAFRLDDRHRAALWPPKGWGEGIVDDAEVNGVAVRRITLLGMRGFNPGPSPQTKGKGPRFSPFPAPQPSKGFPFDPYFYFQYAIETTDLQSELQRLEHDRDQRLAALVDETKASLADLRRRLFLLSAMTLLGVLLGGLTLVWLGLLPLHRLSEAVSRVSEKDFQLRLDPRSLPSELQPIAHRLTETLDQLRRAFDREKQASQDISHDLRTPLAALSTTLEVALKKERTPAEYRELLEECQLSARQMSHLVERLLALARIDAGANPIRPQNLDIVRIAQHAVDLVRPLAKAREITLTVDAPDSLPARADGDKLTEILLNLLHNAIDYNRPAGLIDLMVRGSKDAIEIAVADTGVGIRPEAREHLFERFYRVDPSRQSDTPHCGLGLAIVKSYIDLMGGRIDVHSEVDVGTTFRIRLPLVPPSPDSPAKVAAHREGALT